MADAKLTALTAVSVPDLLDLIYTVDVSDTTDDSAGSSRSLLLNRLLALHPGTPGGRLTLTTGVPVTTADVTGATNLYYTPYMNDRVVVWDGTRWKSIVFTEITLAMGTLTSGLPYDVFAYDSAGSLAIELTAWTDTVTRNFAISILDGRYCKTTNKARLYLGTICTTSTTQTEDSKAKRYLWNMYNRVTKYQSVVDTTDSWTYTTATWRAANNSTSNRVLFVVGLAEDIISAHVAAIMQNAGSIGASPGVGVDSTSANSAQVIAGIAISTSSWGTAHYKGVPGVGAHYLQWLEISQATGTTTWYGDAGLTLLQSGMVAEGRY